MPLRFARPSSAAALAAAAGAGLWGLTQAPLAAALPLPLPLSGREAAAAFVVTGYAAFCGAVVARHRRKRRPVAVAADTLLVAYASQTGFAESLAEQSAEGLRSVGLPAQAVSLADLDGTSLGQAGRVLFVVSTTGDGDPPDTAAAFVRRVMDDGLRLDGLHYGVLALGDSSYRRFCAFGHALDAWLRHAGAQPLFDLVEVDDGDDDALRHWQACLAALAGSGDLPQWSAPSYGQWVLRERRLLNPGSAGGPVFHLSFDVPEGTPPWAAGDIAEIVPHDQGHTTREYSIASVPEDGCLDLVVRQVRFPGGRLGLGSGWLTEEISIGQSVTLRIRTNRAFHPPAADRPLILIGSGTGIAGLRGHLRARARTGRGRTWLIFGERSAAHDAFFRDELEGWLDDGTLARLDTAFSRDQAERHYVQHVLRQKAQDLRAWVAWGAAIYVCGSLRGMGAEVEDALADILGADTLLGLKEKRRYCRDVY